jgi:hypothetical protein
VESRLGRGAGVSEVHASNQYVALGIWDWMDALVKKVKELLEESEPGITVIDISDRELKPAVEEVNDTRNDSDGV